MVDYKKKIRFCELLGASKFQKVVFKVEEIKWNTIHKICPNFIHYYDKFCDFRMKRQLKKVHSPVSQKKIKFMYRTEKLLMRKEFNRKQNRNYHTDENKPTEFIKYLEWNKKIHKNGLVMDLVLFPILLVGGSFLQPGYAATLLGLNIFSCFINFQCINIQNCNIYRVKDCERQLKKVEELQYQHKVKEYSEAIKVIGDCMKKNEDIPTMDEIISNIQSKEQLEQLRRYIQEKRINMNQGTNSVSVVKTKKR